MMHPSAAGVPGVPAVAALRGFNSVRAVADVPTNAFIFAFAGVPAIAALNGFASVLAISGVLAVSVIPAASGVVLLLASVLVKKSLRVRKRFDYRLSDLGLKLSDIWI